jgi:F-type H+-transporting ATPase subunit gamma
MQTQNRIKQQIASTEDLQSVVKTMKSLAAVNVRHFERAARSVDQYNMTVEMGFQILFQQSAGPPPQRFTASRKRTGIFVFGSDQGMCGQFNEHVAEYTAQHIREQFGLKGDVVVTGVGNRIIGHLSERELNIAHIHPMSSGLTRISSLVEAIVDDIDELLAANINSIILFFNRQVRKSSYEPTHVRLLPLDTEWIAEIRQRPWRGGTLPIFTVDRHILLRQLLREYFFVNIYRVIVDSLAAENSARLSSMQAAERNISERLEDLHMQYNRLRQASITEEIMDIVSGFEALT